MPIFLTTFRSSKIYRYAAVFSAVLFMSWFVLPSCLCQLKSLFGINDQASITVSHQQETVNSQKVSPLESTFKSDCNCHHSLDKTFDHVSVSVSIPTDDSNEQAFVLGDKELSPEAAKSIYSNRGPPLEKVDHRLYDAPFYLVHCKFII